MSELTDEVLAEFERLQQEATKTPWHAINYGSHWDIQTTDDYTGPSCFGNDWDDDPQEGEARQIDVGDQEAEANAKLTVLMRNHLSALIATAKRCREYRNKAAAYHDALMMVSRAKEVSMGLDDVIKLAKDELEEIEGQQWAFIHLTHP